MIPVKLPKEVLKLFPTWEHRCPDCGTYVKSNMSFCPNCKTAFDEKRWRVPPRFLKSHDAMSEYAHKVLAPKLTSEQRILLFKYFTELFSDGFESGNFSAWTSTAGSPAVVGSPVHHGNYSGEFDASGEYAQADFTGQTEVYGRCYMRFTTQPTSGSRHLFFDLCHGGTNAHISVELYDSDKWRLLVLTTAGWEIIEVTDPTPTVDTWYCIEMWFNRGVGGGKLWINGSLKATITGTTMSWATMSSVVVGARLLQSSNTINIDCVVVADTYIGPESTVQTYTKTWTTDVLFKKLGITKTFNVDTAFQKQGIPKNFGLDAAFQKSFNIQKQVDALFKRFDIPKSFTLDARFGALVSHIISRQIDVVLKKLDSTKTFGLDVYFGAVEAGTYAKSFGLGVIFAYKVRLPELWLDENGKIVLNISKPYAWVGS